jgi:hypothetical protein
MTLTGGEKLEQESHRPTLRDNVVTIELDGDDVFCLWW